LINYTSSISFKPAKSLPKFINSDEVDTTDGLSFPTDEEAVGLLG
jgi:hypothetical protein